MSHNANKVNSQEPDRAGAISQTFGNLSDVSLTSPQANDYVQYNGTNFVNVSGVSGSFEYILIGQGESNAYSNSGASDLAVGSEVRFYDSNEINTIPSATINKYSSTEWVDYINLPSGNYVIGCSARVEFSSSGHFVFELWSGTGSTSTWSTDLTAHASIGEDLSTYDNAPGYLLQYFELSSSADVAVLVKANSGVQTVANQGNTPSEYNQLLILKV
jgi:hypothetical protein